ncbi:DUF4307 domain-containing protein [Streptomyces sp. A7024]|uniref:DUF4307 domain-containing protein n=1 Tax=Streptomyces coryli TaxID=1128680 RepID=A0A6G4TXP2_9ACTN|nr:DUF4307 domain-containing protein [Streptomyces coryli]NGN63771.1 DUF4307 domain-containing protein [Streptomyces coryli]
MTAVRQQLPEGRYGRAAGSSDARADHRLKIIGLVVGVLAAVGIGWLGYSYISSQDVSGQLVGFDPVSDTKVTARVEVHKDADATGVCTLRALSSDKGEVSRKDVTVAADRGSSAVVTVPMRTTERAASVELIGCKAAGQ